MAGFDDGWDEDLDLGMLSDEAEEDDEGGGWGEDDDDLVFDGEDGIVQPTGVVQDEKEEEEEEEQQHHREQQEEQHHDHQYQPQEIEPSHDEMDQNGWDDDDDDIDLDDDDDDEVFRDLNNDNDYFQEPHIEQPQQEVFEQPEDAGGWSDDEELLVDDDDDDDDNGAEVVEKPHVVAQNLPPMQGSAADDVDPKIVGLTHELEAYIHSLSHMLSSINAILEYGYNTPEKAHELQAYYASREKLSEYTRTKELHRMEYEVVLPYGHVETDKTQIVEFLPDESLVSRCANQSLLADLLQVMTGSDLLVRPQYMAICFAHWCHFKIHLGGERGDMVHCSCKLHLSLPTAEGKRLNVAELNASVVFAPNQPMVEYHLNSIHILLLEKDYPKLRGTAEFLAMIEGHMDEFPEQQAAYSTNAPADNYRDNFVENSQKILSQSTQGMKSALQQVDAVINIQSKLNIVKAGYSTFSKFIPDTESMLAAEEEAIAYAAAQGNASRFPRPIPGPAHHGGSPPPASGHDPSSSFPRPPPSHGPQGPPPPGPHDPSLSFPRPPPSHGSQGHPPPPPPPPPPPHGGLRPQQQQQQPGGSARPQSILGGLMRSGFSRLAKTVAIPDEDDPAIYGAAARPPAVSSSSPPSSSPQAPQLYRPEPVPAGPIVGVEPKTRSGSHLPVVRAPPQPAASSEEQQSNWETSLKLSLPHDTVDTGIAKGKAHPSPSHTRAEQPIKTGGPESPPSKIGGMTSSPVSNRDVRALNPPLPRGQAHPKSDDFAMSLQEPPSMKIQVSASFDTTESLGHASETNEVAREEKMDGESDDLEANESSNETDEEEAEETKGDDQDISLGSDQPETRTRSSPPPLRVGKREIIAHVDYNPEDDIIATRKRWNNPRPHRPHLLL